MATSKVATIHDFSDLKCLQDLMSNSPSPKRQLSAITGVRFFAAAHVMVFHIVVFFAVVGATQPEKHEPFQEWCAQGMAAFGETTWLRAILLSGFSSVSFFFTLSGFILTYTSLNDAGRAAVDRREFWFARFARIYPVYLLGLIVNIPVFLVWLSSQKPPVSPIEGTGIALSAMTLTQAWWSRGAAAWNGPGWSLSVEAFFYFVFPWIVVLIDRFSKRALWAGMVFCCGLAILGPAIYTILDPEGIGPVQWTTDTFWARVVEFNPVSRLPEFLAGMMLGKLVGHQINRGSTSRDKLAAWISTLAAIGLLLALSLSEPIPRLLLYNGLFMTLNLLLIYGLALGVGPLAWVLSRRFFVLLGESSYALYILHHGLLMYGFVAVWLALGGWNLIQQEMERKQKEEQLAAIAEETVPAAVPKESTEISSEATSVPAETAKVSQLNVISPITFLWVSSVLLIALSVVVHKTIEVPARRFLKKRRVKRVARKLETQVA